MIRTLLGKVCVAAAAVTLGIGPLPPYFDARTAGKEPVIKSQGREGNCWAVTASSGIEAALMPQKHIIFSADHMVNRNGFISDPDEGGDHRMIMAYLASRSGPVKESEDPYGDGESPDGLKAGVFVKEMRLFEKADQETVKDALLRWGPVQTSLCMDRRMTASSRSYYDEETGAFYCPSENKVTHDILILGWDDAFPAENFKTTPPGDGAWICQNTWGEAFGDDGIFYVSYDDPNIARTVLAYCRVEETDEEILCQTDPLGWIGRLGYEADTCYFANVYTAPEDGSLTSFGFYAVGPDTGYELYFAPAAGGAFDPGDLEACGSGELTDAGYYTIRPEKEIFLTEGQEFAVAVRIRTEGEKKPVAVELDKDETTALSTLMGKNSYISRDGKEWEQTQKTFGTNVCLKAGITPAE